GMRFRLIHDRHTSRRDGNYRFFGGLVLGTVDGGRGLIEQHTNAALAAGVQVRYGTAVTGLVTDDGAVTGVRCSDSEGDYTVHARGVVLAAGGFEADPTV